MIEISIDEFVNKIKIPNGMKDDIYDLFKNHNEIRKSEELEKIKPLITHAIEIGDLELLQILLCSEIENGGVIYKIDKNKKTASLYKIDKTIDDLFIPYSIEYESINYTVTSIIESGTNSPKNVKSLHFDENSELHTIYMNSFYNSTIESLYIPKNLTELKKGWCYYASNLKKIEISPLNKNFIYKDDQYLLGKTDVNSENYDVLLFARRDIKEVIIPSYIKIISAFAFQSCKGFETIEIPANNELKLLKKCAFALTNINMITIPSSVLKIGKFAFFYCRNLQTIEFSENSELKSIGKYAFVGTKIDKISIPSQVTKICEHAFEIPSLQKVEIPENSQLQIIDNYAFSKTNISYLYIPEKLAELNEGWCNNTLKLNKIEVSPLNKNFIIIDDILLLGKTVKSSDNFDILYFASRNIKKAVIPSNIKIISPFSFYFCDKLHSIEFQENAELQSIEKFAFVNACIEKVSIPPHVSKIGENAFESCQYLSDVNFDRNSELRIIEDYAFSSTQITTISIPSTVTKICDYAFSRCRDLENIEFSNNSELISIGQNSFSNTSINKILIPPHVVEISSFAFNLCRKLKVVDFCENSELQSIGKFSFTDTKIENFFIPSNLIKLEEEIWEPTKITISPLNKNFMMKDGKLLLGKTDLKSDIFDVLLFAYRDIEKVTIPENIKIISSYAFYQCAKLKVIEFPSNSQLQTINKCAFAKSKITMISIPSHVTIIGENAFGLCNNLHTVEIPENSELKSIEKYAFSSTKIKKIFIPAHVLEICQYTFQFCRNLQKIDFSPKSELRLIEENAFSNVNIRDLCIPQHVTKICKSGISYCFNLQIIEIVENSELASIDISMFKNCTNLIFIMIPPNLKKLIKS